MDLEELKTSHADYARAFPGHFNGCKICFILAEVEKLKAELSFNITELVKSEAAVERQHGDLERTMQALIKTEQEVEKLLSY